MCDANDSVSLCYGTMRYMSLNLAIYFMHQQILTFKGTKKKTESCNLDDG